MSIQELKIVINDIIDDYNLDIWLLISIIALGVYMFFIAPLMYVHTSDAVIDGHIINVTSRASGQIIHSYIMKDQEVRKGDILMEIDPKDYQAELIKLETDLEINKEKLRMLTNAPLPEDLEQAKVNSENKTEKIAKPPQYIKGAKDFTNYSKSYETEDLAQQNLERKRLAMGDIVKNMTNTQQADVKALSDTEIENEIAKPEIDKTKIDISNDTVEAVQKTIKDIENQKEEVKLMLSSTRIFAPQDGVVSSVSVNHGDVVNPADVLCTLIPKQVWVIARVNPEQLHKIQVGQYVEVKIPDYKNRKFKATVTSVDTTSKVYRLKAEEQVKQIGIDGKVIEQNIPAYQLKMEFIEDYSDFNIPPDTEVAAKIKVQAF